MNNKNMNKIIMTTFMIATAVISLTACVKPQTGEESSVAETSSVSSPEMKPTRDYFDTLDKEKTLEEIVAEIGPYGVQGSGIIYHVWKLDDGTEAHVVFDSKGKITMIYIIGDDDSERIYKREYEE